MKGADVKDSHAAKHELRLTMPMQAVNELATYSVVTPQADNKFLVAVTNLPPGTAAVTVDIAWNVETRPNALFFQLKELKLAMPCWATMWAMKMLWYMRPELHILRKDDAKVLAGEIANGPDDLRGFMEYHSRSTYLGRQ